MSGGTRVARRPIAVLAILALATVAARPVAAQEPTPSGKPDAGRSPADSLRARHEILRREIEFARQQNLPGYVADSLEAALDSVTMAIDTLGTVDVAARRDALSGEGFPERDSTFRVLADTPGFHVVEYRGREVTLDARNEALALEGDAQVNRGEDVLTADTILYRGAARFMEARRAIELVGADGKQVTSDSVLYYDLSTLTGTVLEAETTFQQRGAEWRVIGNVVPKAQDTVFAAQSRFTSCDLEDPHYTFRAGRIKMVAKDVIVAWPVTLYVANVPVFWLPFFAADIRPGRRSGILPPRFGLNDVVQTSSGAGRNVTDFGYYWAISDYMDAQGTIDWFSGNFTRVNGEFRYRWLKKFVQGGVRYSQSWGETGDNISLDARHDQEFGLNTQLRASVRYISNTQTFQDQSYRPEQQTQTIDSDVGLNRRFSFANLSASARRRQFLGGSRTETTLPSVNLSFSPVTLFSAPRSRAGFFNNMTLSGSGSFSRRTQEEELSDRTTTTAGLRSGLRLQDLNLSGDVGLNDLGQTLRDSTGLALPSTSQTTLQWSASADYQIALVGSTRFRPTVRMQGALFRSDSTGGQFEQAPTRYSVGASLTTDVYGFYPGFGPFARVRHKISPGFDWAYAPAVTVDSALAAIPGFPSATGAARNLLTFNLNQTFEAKRKPRREDLAAAGDTAARGVTGPDTLGAATDTPGAAPPADSVGALVGGIAGEAGPPGGARTGPRERPREEIVTLLAIRTSALQFDFERAKTGEPVLVSDRVSNVLSSDLLRGFQVNMTHDLFEGTGSDRKFKPYLSSLALGFSLRSGGGRGGSRLADAYGTSAGGLSRSRPYGLSEFDSMESDPFAEGGGPWSATLRYSLIRSRPTPDGGGGTQSQTIEGSLSFHPTPHWSVRWATQYNFTESEFGQQLISLDRDLHRWRASFEFARSPNGNVIFQVSVRLTDAPELHGDYNQRTNPPRR